MLSMCYKFLCACSIKFNNANCTYSVLFLSADGLDMSKLLVGSSNVSKIYLKKKDKKFGSFPKSLEFRKFWTEKFNFIAEHLLNLKYIYSFSKYECN